MHTCMVYPECRPFGGVAIVWNKAIKCKISPVPVTSRRMCAIVIQVNGHNIMLFNVYMPSDTQYDRCNLAAFNEVLDEISDICVQYDTNQIIVGGDLNTDLNRNASLHSISLRRFLSQESMKSGLQHVLSDVDFTFMSKISHDRSIIDHFLMTENLFNTICMYRSLHEGDNLSDHSVLQMQLQLPVEYSSEQDVVIRHVSPQCHKADTRQLLQYKMCLDELLERVHVSAELLNCREYDCVEHSDAIECLHRGIVNACLEAGGLTLLHRNDNPRPVPISGWSEFVAERRQNAILWHCIWKQSGSPNRGTIASNRIRSRAEYHYAIRHAKKQTDTMQANKLAESLLNNRTNDFWNDIKRIKGNSKSKSVMVDGISTDANISELFACLTQLHLRNMT